MGTYGTTFIKKGAKKIDLTDSHDGYFSAMGKANLLSIKHIPIKSLHKLVDKFNDFEYKDYDELEITQRQIDEVIYKIDKDTKSDPAALAWINEICEEGIRPSMTGFGPILYLQVNPSLNDSEDCQYVIDMDKEEFLYTPGGEVPQFKLSFEQIKNTPENVLNYLAENIGNNFELIPNSNYEVLELEYDEYSANKTNKGKLKLSEIVGKMQAEVEAVLNVSPEIMKEYDDKKAKEMQEYLKDVEERQKEYKLKNEINEDEDSGGFSIHSCNGVSLPQLRKVIFYMQKYMEKYPEAKFLEQTVEWGFDEDGSSGGFRIFSPKKSNQDTLYENFVRNLSYAFKLKMNIFSSSGAYSNEGKVENEESEMDMFGLGKVQGPSQSIYTLKDIVNINPEWKEAIEDANGQIVYYVYYNEAREVVLSNQMGNENFSLVWTYAAMLNQDSEVFNKVYPVLESAFTKLPNKTKKMIGASLLQSITDGEHINKIENIEGNPNFVSDIKASGLLDILKPYMSNKEVETYFPSKKLKP